MCKYCHEVVHDTSYLCEQCPNPLRAFRDLDIEELLYCQGKTLFIGHHRYVVESVEIGNRLEVGFVFDELFGAAV